VVSLTKAENLSSEEQALVAGTYQNLSNLLLLDIYGVLSFLLAGSTN
jgi:hypothetical protein